MSQIDLGRRAVACGKWRWRPGMLAVRNNGLGIFRITDDDPHVLQFDEDGWRFVGSPLPGVAYNEAALGEYRGGIFDGFDPDVELVPVLEDPATCGCVESLLIEANPDTAIVIAYHPDAAGWCVEVGDRHFYGGDRGEALVAALEAK